MMYCKLVLAHDSRMAAQEPVPASHEQKWNVLRMHKSLDTLRRAHHKQAAFALGLASFDARITHDDGRSIENIYAASAGVASSTKQRRRAVEHSGALKHHSAVHLSDSTTNLQTPEGDGARTSLNVAIAKHGCDPHMLKKHYGLSRTPL